MAAVSDWLRAKATDDLRKKEPVVEIQITGTLTFTRAELDLRQVEQMARDLFAATAVRVRDTTTSTDFDIETTGTMTRPQLERHVLKDLVERDARYRGSGEAWANLIVRVKQMALTGSPPADVVRELQSLSERSSVDVEDSAEQEEAETSPC